MAVDTREKRFSMMNFGLGIHLDNMFEADGTVDADDRQHLLDCYSGIAFAAPAGAAVARYGLHNIAGGFGIRGASMHDDDSEL
jgi:hypothetical protein